MFQIRVPMRTHPLFPILTVSLGLWSQGLQPRPAPRAERRHLLQQIDQRLHEARGKASMDDPVGALAILEAIRRSYGHHRDPALRGKCLEALWEKARLLIDTDHPEGAIELWKAVRRQYGKDRNQAIHRQVLQWRADIIQALCGRSSAQDEHTADGTPNVAYESLQKHFVRARDVGAAKLVVSAMIDHAVSLFSAGRGEEALRINRAVIDWFGNAKDGEIHTLVNTALVNQGVVLHDMKRLPEAIAAYDEVLRGDESFGKDSLEEMTLRALRFKGLSLIELGKPAEALPLFDKVLTGLESEFGEGHLDVEAGILINKGYALGMLGRHQEAIETYDELLRRFNHAEDPRVLERVAIALVNKGAELDASHQGEEACLLFDEVIKRFGDDLYDPSIRTEVVWAGVNKVIVLNDLGRYEASLAAYDALYARWGGATEADSRSHLLLADAAKGETLFKLGRIEEAIAHVQRSLDERGADATAGERSQLLNSIGYWNLILAKKDWEEKGRTAAVEQRLQATLEGFRRDIAGCTEPGSRACSLGNMSYALFLLDRVSESETMMREALGAGGEELYLGELEDAELHPCPLDDGFKAMVQRVWKGLQPAGS